MNNGVHVCSMVYAMTVVGYRLLELDTYKNKIQFVGTIIMDSLNNKGIKHSFAVTQIDTLRPGRYFLCLCPVPESIMVAISMLREFI